MSAARKIEPTPPVSQADLPKMSRSELQALARRVDWYHVIDLGDGIITDGVFDIRPVLSHYNFPTDMRGLRVLDIGRSSGFFSFEFERRGAEVTATDLPTPMDKEYVGHEFTREVLRRRYQKEGSSAPGRDLEAERIDFMLAHTLLRSRVRPLALKITDLSLDAVGGKPYDLVFVGSILNHIKDPAGALERIFSVTGGVCIVCNPIDVKDNSPAMPRARLIGRRGPSLTTWWVPNVACLKEMMECAGFENVQVMSSDLVLRGRHGPMDIPHAVVHGFRPKNHEEAVQKWAAIHR